MNSIYWIIFVLIILIIIYIIGILLFKKYRSKIDPNFIKKINNHLQIIKNMDYKNQILEYDKLLDLCLQEKKLTGSLGEKMKKYDKNFINVNEIWQAHKLRNKLAHEINFTVSDEEYKKAISSFDKEIKKIISCK